MTVKLLEDTPAVLTLGKLCEDHGYSYEWTSGQKPQLNKDGRRIQCSTENYVPMVVPGLSTSSSNSATSTVSNSAKFKSFLLNMCMAVPESTTNYLSSGFVTDGAGRHHLSVSLNFTKFWANLHASRLRGHIAPVSEISSQISRCRDCADENF